MNTSAKNAKIIVVYIILCVVSSMFLSGCWSRREPKTLSLTNSVLFDITDNGDIRITKENMKPSSGGPGAKGGGESKESTVDLLVSEGRTMAEAVLDEINGRAIFGGIIEARLFTERFAKSGLVPSMDFLARDPLLDETPYLAVVRGENAERVYASDIAISEMVGNFISDMAHTQPNIKGESVYVTNLDFLKDYFGEGKQPVMGLIEVEENEAKPITEPKSGSQSAQRSSEKEYMLVYSGLAAFQDDTLVGFMDKLETRAYNLVINKLKGAVVSLPDGLTAAKITKSRSKIKTEVENGQTTIHVNIKVAFSVIQVGEALEANEISSLKPLEQKFNQQLETEISTSIQKAQREFRSDIFGFGAYVRIQHPEDWKNMKNNWDNLFSQAAVDVKVNSTIIISGGTERSIRMEKQNQ